MMSTLRKHGAVLIAIAGICAITFFNLRPYGDPSAAFHLSEAIDEAQPVQPGFVVLGAPAYDGAHYHQVARNIPLLFSQEGRTTLRTLPTTSYSYQRFLLPLTAFVVSLGRVALLPYAFLLINAFAIVGTCAIAKKMTGKNAYALAIAFSPAAAVALHFNLAEPLTLLLLTAFLARFVKNERMDAANVALLSLLMWSREVNVFFAALVTAWLLWKRDWKNASLSLIPLAAFAGLHAAIYGVFDETPFLMSADKRTLPFEAMFTLLAGGYGFDRLTVTSIPLALFFTLPALAWTISLWIRKRDRSFLTVAAGAFLLLMTTMPDHIWGSITSIGRVITPVYPLTLLLAAKHDGTFAKLLACATGIIGIGAAIALASVVHPFSIA